jgi:hypothetical protein
MEDTGRSGGDSGRFVRQADNENIQRELRISREDTEDSELEMQRNLRMI